MFTATARLALVSSRFAGAAVSTSRRLPHSVLPQTCLRSLSSSSDNTTSTSYSPLEWWRRRQSTQESQKYQERVIYMATKADWTLADMNEELEEVVTSWMSKVPGLNNNKETEIAKKLHTVITGVSSVMGKDATLVTLEGMNRTQKLKAAASASTTVEEINMLIQQFSTTTLMHKVLRYRHKNGIKLPETPEATQAIIQSEGRNFLTSTQKQKMQRSSQRSMRKTLRRR